jgi:DNA-binding LytR/AlgR family response regulator
MILKLEQCEAQDDIEITIKYPLNKNKTVKNIASLINSIDIQIPCNSDDGVEIINSSEIYYIESVDDKTIVHCEKNNYSIKKRLYQIYDILKNVGFIQISKYCILNFRMLIKINPLANSHLEAVLKNENRLFVTRKYLAEIKQKLRELL